MERRRARRIALSILYQQEITGVSSAEIIRKKLYAPENEPIPDFTYQLLSGVNRHRPELDKLIDQYAKNWALERLPVIDKNILRLSLFEILYLTDIPVSVSINEAVELGKLYGSNDSSRFINGVLGQITQDLTTPKKRAKGE